MPAGITPEIDRRIRARFPFALTPGQDRAVAEIAADLARDRPMNRLLQADVGAGKTAVAVYAALGVIAHKRQVALLAPTEVLAGQHAAKTGRYLAAAACGFATWRARRRAVPGPRSSRSFAGARWIC